MQIVKTYYLPTLYEECTVRRTSIKISSISAIKVSNQINKNAWKVCVLEDCKSSSKLFKKEQLAHFFLFLSDFTEEWWRVVSKFDDWLKKNHHEIAPST